MRIIYRWGLGWILSVNGRNSAYYKHRWNRWVLHQPQLNLMRDWRIDHE